MEIKYFRLVSAIAESGSLTKAADMLFLTQSALSHQLKEIETQLGCSLFTRVNKKLVITTEGSAFLNSGNVVLGEIVKLQAEIKRLTLGETGRIRLVTQSSTCYHWLPRTLKTFQLEYPNIEVQLNGTPVGKPLELLNAGKVDVALVHSKGSGKSIEFIELFTDEVVALVSATDPLASRAFLAPKDFKLVTYLTHSKRIDESTFFTDFLKPHGVIPMKVIHFELTETIVSMVREGLGMTVMANWLASQYLYPGRIKLVRITRGGLKRKWYIAVPRHGRPAHFERFVQLLRDDIQNLKFSGF